MCKSRQQNFVSETLNIATVDPSGSSLRPISPPYSSPHRDAAVSAVGASLAKLLLFDTLVCTIIF